MRHALRLVMGYMGAVIAATLITVILVAFWVAVSIPGNALDMLRTLPALLLQGAVITAITAFPGWVLAVLLSEQFNERRALFFIVAGGVTAIFAHGLFAYSTGTRDDAVFRGDLQPIIVASILGGLIGGWIHWRIAGRQSGAWRA